MDKKQDATTPMKRHSSLADLSREHFSGLLLSQVLKKNAPPFRGMPTTVVGKIAFLEGQFEHHLKPHFDSEEKILFPFLKSRDETIDVLLLELTKEHILIRDKVKAIRDSGEQESELDSLGYLLETHIRKEERQLFQIAQEKLSESELQELGKLLSAQ